MHLWLDNIMDMFQEEGIFTLTQHCAPPISSPAGKSCFDSLKNASSSQISWGAFLKRKLNQFDWKPFVKLCFLQHVSIFESPLPALLMRTWKITQPSDKIPMPKNLKKSTYTLCYTPMKGGYRKQVHSIMLLGLVGYMIDKETLQCPILTPAP